jgi:hypothetical protein
MTRPFKIAVLLPTRGRTDALARSIISLFNRAVDKSSIQLMMIFDHDDDIGYGYFERKIRPWLDDHEIDYTALGVDSMGYEGLNRYYNTMAESCDADWFFIWNDDAIMETTGWDQIITKNTGEFKLLAVRTHNDHPYSIFPIIPREWYDLFGLLSRHQMIDAEFSQLAYMLNIFERVDIFVTHDRADLTGNNADETDKKRVRFEGNPENPHDFHHTLYSKQRLVDAETIAQYMKSIGMDVEFWTNVKAGKQYPWEQLIKNDTNKQMRQFGVTVDPVTNKVVAIKPDDHANIVRQQNES